MAIVSPHRIPVIVGVADVIDRPADLARAREPAALMADALLGALRDAVGDAARSLLTALDSLDIVAEHSWPYDEPGDVLTARIGHVPKRCVYGVAGGESPVRLIHEAALRIASGDSAVAAIVGAESQYSVVTASKQSISLAWSPRGSNAGLLRGKDLCHPIAISHGMTQPVHVYPLYENAATAAWGQTPAEAMRESAQLWSEFSRVAAERPYAWIKQSYSVAQLATPSQENRLVAWPYTKHMVANPFVNQGAAVVVTSLAKARELGIAEERCVFIHAGAWANEPRDYLQRDQYQRSYAQEAVLEAMHDAAAQFDERRDAAGRVDAAAMRQTPGKCDTAAMRHVPGQFDAAAMSEAPGKCDAAAMRHVPGQFDAAAMSEAPGQVDGVAMREAAGRSDAVELGRFDAVELYSCFPIVPKMARRVLALPANAALTSIGGLSFFGAPLNNYMTHAAAGLVRQLRSRRSGLALLYGQGEFVTKHHALLLSSSPPQHDLAGSDGSVQTRADRYRRPVPQLTNDYRGPATLETFTVVYGRSMDPDFGTVIARTPEDRRLMARVASTDNSSVQVLTSLSTTPIGRVGQVTRGTDNLLYWTVT